MLTVQNGELIELPAEPPVGAIACDDAARRLGVDYATIIFLKSLSFADLVWRDPSTGVPWISAASLRRLREALEPCDRPWDWPFEIEIYRPGDY